MSKVVTRIAPSPTGAMHIGTARTALFNYLFAKHHGGDFRLRIEDTDKERSTEDAAKGILDGLAAFGLAVDGDVVYQSANAARHVDAAYALLARGAAYKCFMSPADADAWKAENRNKAFRSDWRNAGDHPSPHTPFVVRLKVPDGETVVNDLIKGAIHFDNANLDDLVLLRSDGTPTYNLAVVVDDHDMGVSHVLRGDDHVNNTPRQILIYKGIGWDVPVFGHIPLIYGEDGKKLSKRRGAAAVTDYLDMGYLPEALRNYFTRLGWGFTGAAADDIFSMADAIAAFDGTGIVPSPARMDSKKMKFINQHYNQLADPVRLAGLVYPSATGDDLAEKARVISLLRGSCQLVPEIAEACRFVWESPNSTYDVKVTNLLADPDNNARLRRLAGMLMDFRNADSSPWRAAEINALIHDFAEREGVKMGKIGPMVRGALIGDSRPSADLGAMMEALGFGATFARLQDAFV